MAIADLVIVSSVRFSKFPVLLRVSVHHLRVSVQLRTVPEGRPKLGRNNFLGKGEAIRRSVVPDTSEVFCEPRRKEKEKGKEKEKKSLVFFLTLPSFTWLARGTNTRKTLHTYYNNRCTRFSRCSRSRQLGTRSPRRTLLHSSTLILHSNRS